MSLDSFSPPTADTVGKVITCKAAIALEAKKDLIVSTRRRSVAFASQPIFACDDNCV